MMFFRPAKPTTDSLISEAYPAPDYRDAYVATFPDGLRVEQFAAAFFLGQPRWLAAVSMRLASDSRTAALGDRTFPAGSNVGSWIVHGRSENEILFGEHMGFMEYRFSLLRRPGGIEAGTSVRYLTRFAPIYFALVRPFHVGFVKLALRNAAEHSMSLHLDGVRPEHLEVGQ